MQIFDLLSRIQSSGTQNKTSPYIEDKQRDLQCVWLCPNTKPQVSKAWMEGHGLTDSKAVLLETDCSKEVFLRSWMLPSDNSSRILYHFLTYHLMKLNIYLHVSELHCKNVSTMPHI